MRVAPAAIAPPFSEWGAALLTPQPYTKKEIFIRNGSCGNGSTHDRGLARDLCAWVTDGNPKAELHKVAGAGKVAGAELRAQRSTHTVKVNLEVRQQQT